MSTNQSEKFLISEKIKQIEKKLKLRKLSMGKSSSAQVILTQSHNHLRKTNEGKRIYQSIDNRVSLPDSQIRENTKEAGKQRMMSVKQSALVADSVQMDDIEISRVSEVNLYDNKSDEVESPKKEMDIMQDGGDKNENIVQINIGIDQSTSIRKSLTSKNLRKDFFEAQIYTQGDLQILKGRYKLNSLKVNQRMGFTGGDQTLQKRNIGKNLL